MEVKDIPDIHLYCPLCLAEDGTVAHGGAAHFLSLECRDKRILIQVVAFYVFMEDFLQIFTGFGTAAWIAHAETVRRGNRDSTWHNETRLHQELGFLFELVPVLYHLQWIVYTSSPDSIWSGGMTC